MCGIAGIVSFTTNEAVQYSDLKRMTDPIQHRGPDDEGHNIIGHAGLGFRRLSIIDLSANGHQPMSSSDGSYWIVFNGEIYNFQILRSELQHEGITFRSKTDTEVILAMYIRDGDNFLQKLRGMFALAIWDIKKERLILARDRVGKKPLHYFYNGSLLIFGSEIKSLLTHSKVSKDIDWTALDEYFTYGFVSAPRSIYRDIRKVLPLTYLIVDKNGIQEKPYWNIPAEQNDLTISIPDALSRVEQKLRESVAIRMISDVPLGAFLSGGIDSSLVVAYMAEQSSRPVKTFSIGFSESSFDESVYAQEVVHRFSTDHTIFTVSPQSKNIISDILVDFDEPFGDSSALPTYIVSQMTRKEVTVALSGDGGDEVFGGYDIYTQTLSQKFLPPLFRRGFQIVGNVIPYSVRGGRKLRTLAVQNHEELFIALSTIYDKPYRNSLFSSKILNAIGGFDSSDIKRSHFRRADKFSMLRKLQYNDVKHYMSDDILVKVDRMSMLNSLEVRSPFLDHEVIELAFSLPLAVGAPHYERKFLLKQLLLKYFPKDFVYRTKKGFAVPLKYWFAEDFGKFFKEVVFCPEIENSEILQMDTVRKMLLLHNEGKRDLSSPLWLILAFAIWYKNNLQ